MYGAAPFILQEKAIYTHAHTRTHKTLKSAEKQTRIVPNVADHIKVRF